MLTAFDAELSEMMFLPEADFVEAVNQFLIADKSALADHARGTAYSRRHAAFQASVPTMLQVRRTHLWVHALTHKSFKPPHVADDEYFVPGAHGSYERLEFLGDAVLQVVTSLRLLQLFPFQTVIHGSVVAMGTNLCARLTGTNGQEDFLHKVRSALVNNVRLGQVGLSLQLDQIVRVGANTDGIKLAHVLADALEAMLAVVFLENGLDPIEAFLRHNLFPLIDEAVRNREWLSKKQRLVTLLKKHHPGVCVDGQVASDGQQHAVSLIVDEFLVCRAQAPSIDQAWERAATKAMQLFGF